MDEHTPPPQDVRDTIDLWVSDFLDRPAARDVAARAGPEAQGVLVAFLEACCHGGKAPADLEAADASHAFLDHLSQLDLAPAHRSAVPDLVAAFLSDLEDQGRLAGGRGIAGRVRAAEPAFRDRAAGKAPDLTRRAAKVGRNDPCPCGSGRKYKQCCLRTLG
jgi:SEC-C motif-containing protein